MKITVFGAAGEVGSRVVAEALSRGHQVTAVVRNEAQFGKLPKAASANAADVGDANEVARLMAGQDLAISAIRPPQGHEEALVPLTRSVLEGAKMSRVRVLIVGGAASLKMPDLSGDTVLTAPNFLPESVVPIARAGFAQYELCAAEMRDDLSYLCPPAMLTPGQRTGHYRLGSDTLLIDETGASRISMEDFAAALLDEAEKPRHKGKRFTVAY